MESILEDIPAPDKAAFVEAQKSNQVVGEFRGHKGRNLLSLYLLFAETIQLKSIKTLVEAGCDINQVCQKGWTPIFNAVARNT